MVIERRLTAFLMLAACISCQLVDSATQPSSTSSYINVPLRWLTQVICPVALSVEQWFWRCCSAVICILCAVYSVTKHHPSRIARHAYLTHFPHPCAPCCQTQIIQFWAKLKTKKELQISNNGEGPKYCPIGCGVVAVACKPDYYCWQTSYTHIHIHRLGSHKFPLSLCMSVGVCIMQLSAPSICGTATSSCCSIDKCQSDGRAKKSSKESHTRMRLS